MYRLFVDESGKNDLVNIEPELPFFGVAGALVHDNANDFIRRRAEQIKYKYWNDTSINFHAHDLRRLSKDFRIFQNNQSLLQDFCSDFLVFLERANFKILFVCKNKFTHISSNPPIAHAIKNGFKKDIHTFEKNLNEHLFEEIWKRYLCYLIKKKGRGTIVIEASDRNQDTDILWAYNKLMSHGVSNMGLSNLDVRDKLTSISFVTKNNLDIETQLADFASYYLNLDERASSGLVHKPLTPFDIDVIRIMKTKSFTAKCNGSKYNSCVIL